MQLPDNIQKVVTLIGAVVAALASVANFWWTYRAKVDRITVIFGPTRPPTEPGEWLHIVSQSDHQINLRDYGFIGPSGALLSVPQLDNDQSGESFDQVYARGSTTFEKRGDLYETGPYNLPEKQIGAYAVTLGSERYSVSFFGVPRYKRLWLRLKIWWKPTYR